jgi:GAF domain-containing protein
MSFQDIVESLLLETGASRTTLRLDRPGAVFPVVAEALAPGIGSIAGDTSIDLRASPTFQFLDRERRLLVQPDLLDSDPAPPPELIEQYGARAQIVAPIVRDERLAGLVSVHYSPAAREWTAEDVAAVERATAQVHAELG